MILENDFKIHVFLAAVESAVAAVMASSVVSRFKDPAQKQLSYSSLHGSCTILDNSHPKLQPHVIQKNCTEFGTHLAYRNQITAKRH